MHAAVALLSDCMQKSADATVAYKNSASQTKEQTNLTNSPY